MSVVESINVKNKCKHLMVWRTVLKRGDFTWVICTRCDHGFYTKVKFHNYWGEESDHV